MRLNSTPFLRGYLEISTENKCDLSSVGFSSNRLKKCLFPAKETLMYRTVFWTLWERERVG